MKVITSIIVGCLIGVMVGCSSTPTYHRQVTITKADGSIEQTTYRVTGVPSRIKAMETK